MEPIQEQKNQLSSSPLIISVLIVDDVPETRRIVKILLDDPRIRIVGEAGDGNEALHQFHKLLPDVVLMNINMPVRNGLEVTELMRVLEPDANIIILSVQSDQNYMRRSLLAGACDYLTKPPDRDELIEGVIRAAKRGRILPPSEPAS